MVLRKDSRGALHKTDDTLDTTALKIFEVAVWSSTKGPPLIRGPKSAVICQTKGWKLNGNEVNLDALSISHMTSALQLRNFKPPPAELAWTKKLCPPGGSISLPFPKLWKMHSPFLTPRDQVTFFRVRHRNLFVAKLLNDPDRRSCRFCPQEENIQHLAECPFIYNNFWLHILNLMNEFETEDPDDPTSFILLGRINNEQPANIIQTTILNLAWRCLYATIVGSRVDGKSANLDNTLARFASMLHSRVDAYGLKWRNWSQKNRWSGNLHIIPSKHRDKGLISQEWDGQYSLSPKITKFHEACIKPP